jgi:hypothetical protein
MNEKAKQIYRPSLLLGVVLGGLTSLAVIGLSYLGEQGAGLPFLAFDMFDWLARVVPGHVAAAGVDTMVRIITFLGLGPIGSIAEAMEQLQGILMLIVGGALLGLIITLVARYSAWPGRYVGFVGGLVAFGLVAAMEISLKTSIANSPSVDLVWLAALLIVWATLLGGWLDGRRFSKPAGEMTQEIDIARRRFLVKLAGGSVGLALGAWGIGRLLAERPGLALAGQPLSRLTTVTPQSSFRAIPQGTATPVPAATATAILEDRIQPAPGYGMKQPKWMTSMEAIGHEASGYWEERGWSVQARPHIVSIIDTVAKDYVQSGRIPVGGIAWAGDRGIQKVELCVDNGDWMEAELRTPPLSPLTWVQWRYNWPSVPGHHTFTVRATDGTGMQQIGTSQPPYPDGATGYDSVTVTI